MDGQTKTTVCISSLREQSWHYYTLFIMSTNALKTNNVLL